MSDSRSSETVGEALERYRGLLDGKVSDLVLCKYELFYMMKEGGSFEETVYPVSRKTIELEARKMGVEWTEI